METGATATFPLVCAGWTARSCRLVTRHPMDIGAVRALVCELPTAIWIERSAKFNIPRDFASRPAL